MSEDIDFRVSAGIADHPKWLGLLAACGPRGTTALVTLWAWARGHRSNGDLAGMSPEAIETAARWQGKRGTFHEALLSLRWLDPDGKLHGWQERNGWASGSASRSYAGKVGGIVKQCLRRGLTPTRYIEIQGGAIATDANLKADVQRAYDSAMAKRGSKGSGLATLPKRSRPRPSPSPSPTPTPKEGGGREDGGSASGLAEDGPPASPPGCSEPGCTNLASAGPGTVQPTPWQPDMPPMCGDHFAERVYGRPKAISVSTAPRDRQTCRRPRVPRREPWVDQTTGDTVERPISNPGAS